MKFPEAHKFDPTDYRTVGHGFHDARYTAFGPFNYYEAGQIVLTDEFNKDPSGRHRFGCLARDTAQVYLMSEAPKLYLPDGRPVVKAHLTGSYSYHWRTVAHYGHRTVDLTSLFVDYQHNVAVPLRANDVWYPHRDARPHTLRSVFRAKFRRAKDERALRAALKPVIEVATVTRKLALSSPGSDAACKVSAPYYDSHSGRGFVPPKDVWADIVKAVQAGKLESVDPLMVAWALADPKPLSSAVFDATCEVVESPYLRVVK